MNNLYIVPAIPSNIKSIIGLIAEKQYSFNLICYATDMHFYIFWNMESWGIQLNSVFMEICKFCLNKLEIATWLVEIPWGIPVLLLYCLVHDVLLLNIVESHEIRQHSVFLHFSPTSVSISFIMLGIIYCIQMLMIFRNINSDQTDYRLGFQNPKHCTFIFFNLQ